MFLSLFNQLSSVDPQTQQLLNNLMEVLLPILYAIGDCRLAFSTIKYAFKIHSDPEIFKTHGLKCFRMFHDFNVFGYCSYYFCKNARFIVIMKCNECWRRAIWSMKSVLYGNTFYKFICTKHYFSYARSLIWKKIRR